MTIRNIIPLGDPKLKAKNKIIAKVNSKKLKQLVQDLKDTMIKADLVGIAAPQIGENYKVFLTQPRSTKTRKNIINDRLRVFINPHIVKQSKTECIIWEGCGCTGDIFGPVKRAKEVSLRALDENGKKFQIKANGLLARIFLHEMDHLQGMEFVQRITDNSKLAHKDYYISNIRNSKRNVENSKTTKIEVKSF